jgi:hypothetical protein
MEEMAEILENKLADAVEVKNRASLHQYTLLIVQNVTSRQRFETEQLRTAGALEAMVAELKEFRLTMDKRFEEHKEYFDKRFDDQKEHTDRQFAAMEKRFEERKEQSDQQFGAMEKRFEDQKDFFDKRISESEKHFNRFFTFISLSLGLMMALLSYGTFFVR